MRGISDEGLQRAGALFDVDDSVMMSLLEGLEGHDCHLMTSDDPECAGWKLDDAMETQVFTNGSEQLIPGLFGETPGGGWLIVWGPRRVVGSRWWVKWVGMFWQEMACE